jgi:hypothetical protein
VTLIGIRIIQEGETMSQVPHFATPLDAARFLVQEHRLHELWFESLSPDDCDVVIVDLGASLSRARRRALRSHLIGATLTACFLALGLALMMIGPAAVRGAFDEVLGRTTLRSAAATWPLLVLVAALGAVTADYLLRGRLRTARRWDHDCAAIRDAVRRATTARSSLHAPSNENDGQSAAGDWSHVRAAVTVLRKHEHERSHYLIERLTHAANGGPTTAETWAALGTACRILREECGAHAEADSLQQWTAMHNPHTV